MNAKGSRILALGEASRQFGLPAAWLAREASSGELPCLLAGNRLFFDEESLRAAITKRIRGGIGIERRPPCSKQGQDEETTR
jgi:hypothetical protein